MSDALVVVEEDGNVTVDGMSVAAWLTSWYLPPSSCKHEPRDDPRFANTCRRCGRRIDE